MLTFRKTFFWLISFPEILFGAISWILFCNFAVSSLVQNKSVLTKEKNKNLVLVLYLILTYLVLKRADTAKLKNGTQEIAIHPGHKKVEFSRVPMKSSLLPKTVWEQELNSKKWKKQSFLQKLICLTNAFQNAFQILLLDKLWRMLLSEIFGR